MKVIDIFSHRNGRDILESPRFVAAFREFTDVLSGIPPYRASSVKKTSAEHVIAPGAMNGWLDNELCVKRDWDWHPLVIETDPADKERKSQLRSDFRKSRIEVEVQFGNVARYAYDVYKMAISLALQQADVGIQVVCSKRFAAITGGNIAYFERVVRELERSRLTLIVPLVVIGIEPDHWDVDAYPPEAQAPKITRKSLMQLAGNVGNRPYPRKLQTPRTHSPSTTFNGFQHVSRHSGWKLPANWDGSCNPAFPHGQQTAICRILR